MSSHDSMNARDWVVARFLPAIIIAVGVTVGLTYFRASSVFLIGFQGMFAGGLIGWLVGRLGRSDSGAYWNFQQRCWLGVSLMIIYLVAGLVTLSVLNAGPLDPPLYWVGQVVEGFQEEAFISAGRFQMAQGKLEAGWWIFMNGLDAGLFWFLFIAFCLVGVSPDKKESDIDASQTDEPLSGTQRDSAEACDDPATDLQPGSGAAFYAMLCVLLSLLIASGLYWKVLHGDEPQMGYSEGIAAMKPYEGPWRFKHGLGLVTEDADARSFTISTLGRGSLLLKGTTHNFTLSLDQEGPLFSGLLFMLRDSGSAAQFSARVRFSPEKDTLILSVVNFEMGGRRDLVLEAEKIPL